MARGGALEELLAAADLPPAVSGCLAAAGPELRAALKKDPSLIKKLKRFLDAAGAVLGLPAGTALFFTGFAPGDRTPGRLEAALAELRAALFLRSEGFDGIRAVERAAGKTADLRARRAGTEYFFEVRRVTGGLDGDPVKRLAAKLEKKSAQVRTTLKRHGGSAAGGIIFAAGALHFGAFRRSRALLETARAAHSSQARPGLHVCLLEGGSCAVFPPWGGGA
ncbi:MAG TPA: hypothetical protein DEQ38_05830 [Elusimicrobia bacterium]|nr:MAG: hypothetical protein A2089_08705 [Elusimicrobia bacterium GWD2_63_28]HCC47621.1 hypothetical protein [Elusimicrobiota bacterium]